MKDIFGDIVPVLRKAAPTMCLYLSTPLARIICALLATLVNAKANDPQDVAQKLANDPDLYAKLANIEATHAEFIKSYKARSEN